MLKEVRSDLVKLLTSGIELLCSDAIQHGAHQVADSSLVVWRGFVVHAVGDDGAHGHSLMAHQTCKSLQGGALHLIVGYAPVAKAELLYAAVEFGIGKREAKLASLRTVEPDR